MIPATDEDRLKARVYNQLSGSLGKLTIPEFVLLCRRTYESERYKRHWFNSAKSSSLEEQLLSLAYTFLNTPLEKQRGVDAHALKLIKKQNKCRGSEPVAIHYFRIYNGIKRGLSDLMAGNVYIEDQIEFEDPGGLKYNTLEGELHKLALKYKKVSDSKKRKIDHQALATIGRCAACRNSPSLTRYYYGFYRDLKRKE